ncbi:hypothetical protein [Streptomyces lydicus]
MLGSYAAEAVVMMLRFMFVERRHHLWPDGVAAGRKTSSPRLVIW